MKLKLCTIICLILTAIGLILFQYREEKEEMILKSYNNTVALYKNGIKKEIFEQIVLNSLPEKDKIDLKKGIKIESEDELLRILEDFDG